jgi:hypothetical protein
MTEKQMCEMEGCTEEAIGWVEAQWTIADFVRYEACFPHLWEIEEDLRQRTVEGIHAWPHVFTYDLELWPESATEGWP